MTWSPHPTQTREQFLNQPDPGWHKPRAAANTNKALIGSGVAMALLFPIIGFIIAVVLLIKNQIGPGLGVMALCPVGVVLGLMLLAGSA